MLISGAYLTAFIGTGSAHAQAAGTQATEEIVITGTRIRGAEAVGSNVIGIGNKEIAQTGLVTSTELLRSIPQVSNLGADDSRTSGPQRAVANVVSGSAVNLRGLGVEATLALVDGRRPIRNNEARSFEMNNIPSIVLQRVEVVPDGASAIYGSDAVTGVVNLVPYHSYQGATVRANYGSADSLHQYTLSALGGHSWDSGNVVVAFEHYKRSLLLASDRPELYNDSISTAGTIGTSTNSSPGNVGSLPFLHPILDSNNDGRLSAAEYAASNANNTPNRQSNWLGVGVLPEQKRDSFFGYAEQELTDRLKLYGETFYSKRQYIRLTASPTPTITSVPASNFYNQTGVAVPYAYSFINDLGATRSSGREVSRQATLGLKFDLGNHWQTEAFYSDGQTKNRINTNNQINNAALTAALANNTAAAFNPFGVGLTQRSTLDSIAGTQDTTGDLKLKNAALKADGPIFTLPGGEVRVAGGLEYAQENRATGLSNTSSGPNVNTLFVGPNQTMKRKVSSAYAELLLPIIGTKNAMPGIKRLTLSLADRYDRYDDSIPGTSLLKTSTTNPKFGITWQVVDDFKLRGSYGTSFRAPSIGDYFFGAPTFQAAASAAAVPHTPGLLGLPNGPVAAVLIQGGRTDGVLKPETAKTWSIGADFTPASVPGLNLGLTYYNIKYENQIQTAATNTSFTNPDYANALAAAGFAIANPTTAQLQQFLAFGGANTTHIGPPNVVLYGSGSSPVGPQSIPIFLLIDSRSVNSGLLKTNGWDFTARYTMRTMSGNWTFADTFTYVSDFRQSLLPGTSLIGWLNTYGYPLRFSTRAQAGWEKNGMSANVFVNYANGYTNTQVTPNVGIASYTTIDASLSYDTGTANTAYGLSNVRVQLSAQNLFDRKPPFALVGNPAQTFDTQNASAIGRLVALTVEKKF